MAHSYSTRQQADGLFCADIVGGHIELVKDCRSEQEAVNSALYAISKNKEYQEEARLEKDLARRVLG